MRVLSCIVALLLALTGAGPARAVVVPRVRVEIAEVQPVLVGQQVRVRVTVLAPNFFLSSPQFPTFDIPGAIVTLLDENALNSSENIGGQTYAGITRSYTVTPQHPGVFTLPPVKIPFRYAAEPGQPGVDGFVALPPQTLTARLPAGAPSLVAKVAVTQSLDGDPKTMRVGDALTRTVDILAADTHAMMIPPTKFEAPSGVRVYVHDPVVTDVTTDRGVFSGGRRIDRATYVFEHPGTYTLPAVEVGWFDAASGKQRVDRAPEIVVSVLPAPAIAPRSEIAPPGLAGEPTENTGWWSVLFWSLGLSIAALAVFGLLRQFFPLARGWVQARRGAWQASERAAFGRLKRACLSNDAPVAYRELSVWVRREGFTGLSDVRKRKLNLGREIGALEQHLYGSSPPAAWDGRAMLDRVVTIRTSYRSLAGRTRPSMLPALNP